MQTARSFIIAYTLTLIIAVCAALAAAGGLFLSGLYRDSETIRRAWLANDSITLLVIVPALLWIVQKARRGDIKAVLLWMGLLSYMLYNYAFYLFGAVFNTFFPLYILLFTLPFYALGLLLSVMDRAARREQVRIHGGYRGISLYMLLVALPLGAFELGQYMLFVFRGQLPQAPTLVFALDLSFVIPNMLLAAYLLWQQNVWGYVLSVVMLTKGVTYGLVLVAGTVFMGLGPMATWDPLLPFYGFVFIGSAFCVWWLLKRRVVNSAAENKTAESVLLK